MIKGNIRKLSKQENKIRRLYLKDINFIRFKIKTKIGRIKRSTKI